MEIINPATEEIIATVDKDDRVSLVAKFMKLQSGQKRWEEEVSLSERVEILKKFSGLLREREVTLAETLTQEIGKPLYESVNELRGAQERIAFFLDQSLNFLSPKKV